MTEFEAQTIVLALQKMFDDGYFDICVVDKCLKLARSVPPAADYNVLCALHCVHWNKMESGFRTEVMKRTLALFAHEGLPGITRLQAMIEKRAMQ